MGSDEHASGALRALLISRSTRNQQRQEGRCAQPPQVSNLNLFEEALRHRVHASPGADA